MNAPTRIEIAITTVVSLINSSRVGQVTRLSSATTSFKNLTGDTFGIDGVFGLSIQYLIISHRFFFANASTFAKATADKSADVSLSNPPEWKERLTKTPSQGFPHSVAHDGAFVKRGGRTITASESVEPGSGTHTTRHSFCRLVLRSCIRRNDPEDLRFRNTHFRP